ncbi:hypothetical protein Tco_0806187 [Tanacetum coccineum]
MSASQDEIPPPPPPPPSSSQTPTQQTPHTVSTIKLPILKKGEYDIWAMKMEHYLAHTDYPIWEVIQNGNGPVSITTDTSGQIKVLPPRTAEEIVARERERKARTTLLMALPEDHLAKFHKMTDAKEMWDAIKSRFGGNDESKKICKNLDLMKYLCNSTPIETQKPLVKDEEASDVDAHLYRSMIGSLMYLTASRPDIMFVVCACSRFQITPKSSHLSIVTILEQILTGNPQQEVVNFLAEDSFLGNAKSKPLWLLLLRRQNMLLLPAVVGKFCGFKIKCYTMGSTS